MDLESRLTQVFRTVFDDDMIEISRSLTADDVDGWDSLSHVNLLLAIELELALNSSSMRPRASTTWAS